MNKIKNMKYQKNKELLTWLEEVIRNGYHLFIDIENLQELIDNIEENKQSRHM